MKALINRIALVGLACGAIAGCSGRQETVTSQRQSNWSKSKPDAMATATPEPDEPIRAETHFAAGQLFEKQGSLDRAVAQYKKVLEMQPKHIAAMNQLGMCYAKMGRHEEAETALKQALKLDPNSASLHNNLGFSYIAEKRWTEAEQELRKAIDLKPDFARARINLGMVLAYRDRHDEALESFLAVLPEPEAYYNLGLLYRAQRQYREAAMSFEQALDLNPRYAAARQQLDSLKIRIRKGPDVSPNPALDPSTIAPEVSSARQPAQTGQQPQEMQLVADLSKPQIAENEINTIAQAEMNSTASSATQTMQAEQAARPEQPAQSPFMQSPAAEEPAMAQAEAPQPRQHDMPPAPPIAPPAVMAPRIEAALSGSEVTIPFMGSSLTTKPADIPPAELANAQHSAMNPAPASEAAPDAQAIQPMYPMETTTATAAAAASEIPCTEETRSAPASPLAETRGDVLYLSMTPIGEAQAAPANLPFMSHPAAAEESSDAVAYQNLTGKDQLILPMYPIEIKDAPANAPTTPDPMSADMVSMMPDEALPPNEERASLASSMHDRRPLDKPRAEQASMRGSSGAVIKTTSKASTPTKATSANEPEMGVMVPVP